MDGTSDTTVDDGTSDTEVEALISEGGGVWLSDGALPDVDIEAHSELVGMHVEDVGKHVVVAQSVVGYQEVVELTEEG